MNRIPPPRTIDPRPAAGRAGRRPATPTHARLLLACFSVAIAACSPTVPATRTPAADSRGLAPTAEAATATAEEPSADTRVTPSPAPSPGPPTSIISPAPSTALGRPDLLLLAFEGDVAMLSLVRLSGTVVALPLPDPAVAAVAPTEGGQLVAVLRDGRTYLAPRDAAGLAAGAGWRALAVAGRGELPPGAIVWSATSSPDGARLAAIARPRDAESPSALVVIEPGRLRRTVLALEADSEGAPPAWIDDGRVAILQRDRFDQPFVAIIAVASGRVTDRLPIGPLALATSGDARTIALLTGDRITVGPTASLLAPLPGPSTALAMTPGDRVRGGLALSSDGRFLAVAVEQGDGGPGRIAIYQHVSDAWRSAARIAPPVSASGGWLAWLP